MATATSFELGSASFAQDSSANTTTDATLTKPAGAQAMVLTVETTSARVVFDGTTPASDNGIVVAKDAAPLFLPFAADVKWRSTAGTAAVVNVLWLF